MKYSNFKKITRLNTFIYKNISEIKSVQIIVYFIINFNEEPQKVLRR